MPTQFTQFKKGDPAYNIDYKAVAPSVGLAWTPRFSNSFLDRVFGENGKSVFRGGFSMSYNRYSMGDYNSIFGSNPGASLTANRSQALGNLIPYGPVVAASVP